MVRDPDFRSIAATLNGAIWCWATLCAVLIAIVQTLVSYRHISVELENDLRQIGLTQVPLLSVSIWDIEPRAVQWQLDNLVKRDSIGFARLTVETGQIFVAGDPGLAHGAASRRFEVPPPERTSGVIGVLEVYSNPAAIYREWLYSVGLAILAYGLLTLLICGIVAYVLRRELEKPMHLIARFTRELTPERLTTPLLLERPGHRQRDEIDLVVEGFRVLQAGVDRHIANLDEQVEVRTRELEQALESIRRLSHVDSLTGCFNRRHFNEQIVRELERAERYGRTLTILFCDIDHFKRINDAHGHLAGDEVLTAVAGCFRKSLRDGIDWAARYGGEEFVIVLPETDLAEGLLTAERLRRLVAESLAVAVGKTVLRVTASFGVADYHPGETMTQLLEVADQQLYRAKAAGRNRVSPSPPG